MKTIALMLMLPLIALAFGCAPVATRTYSVTVKNESSTTVIVWLTKNGGPLEPGWQSPEDLAIGQPERNEPFAFQTTPPGRTAELQNITGHFEEGVDAVLRVYVGQHSFNDILAMSHESPERIEIVLHPGNNSLVVVNDHASPAGVSVKSLPP
ncbi:MAG TPA: hypothetical protein VH518_13170 [Tepidisphaeraceae bacterium]|jgi:hypothetical protein